MESTEEIKPILLKFAPAWKRVLSYVIDMILLLTLLTFILMLAFDEQFKLVINSAPGQYVSSTTDEIQKQSNTTYIDYITRGSNAIILSNKTLIYVVALILFAAYFTLFWAASGQTLGNKIFKIAVIDIKSTPITLVQALSRTGLLLLSQSVWHIPMLLVIQPVYKQRIHDHFSRTVVIELPDDLKQQIEKQKGLLQQSANEQDS